MKTEMMSLFVESDSDAEDGMKFFLVAKRHEFWTNSEQVKISEVEATFSAPSGMTANDIRMCAIRTLRERQDYVIAKAQKEQAELQHKIDQLLMLTHIQENVG